MSGTYPNSQTLGCLHTSRPVHTCIYTCTENGHRAPAATVHVYTRAHMHCGIIVLMALLHDCTSTGWMHTSLMTCAHEHSSHLCPQAQAPLCVHISNMHVCKHTLTSQHARRLSHALAPGYTQVHSYTLSACRFTHLCPVKPRMHVSVHARTHSHTHTHAWRGSHTATLTHLHGTTCAQGQRGYG